MSNKFFKKLSLTLAIIFTFSLIPGMILCNAEKSVTDDLGTAKLYYKAHASVYPTHTICRDIENAEKLNFTTQITSPTRRPDFTLSMFECGDKECMTHRQGCDFSQKFNTTEPSSLIVEGEQLKDCFLDHFRIMLNYPIDETVKFKSELTASSSTKDPVIKTPNKCSAASSLVAPLGAIAAAILGLLAL